MHQRVRSEVLFPSELNEGCNVHTFGIKAYVLSKNIVNRTKQIVIVLSTVCGFRNKIFSVSRDYAKSKAEPNEGMHVSSEKKTTLKSSTFRVLREWAANFCCPQSNIEPTGSVFGVAKSQGDRHKICDLIMAICHFYTYLLLNLVGPEIAVHMHYAAPKVDVLLGLNALWHWRRLRPRFSGNRLHSHRPPKKIPME